jgi:transcriptional regulator of met regulon
MFKPKTHFEQVPLKAVRQIVKEQTRRKTKVVQAKGTKKRTLKESFLSAEHNQ